MGCLGAHFSLSADEVEQLRAIEDESARVEHIQEVIEEEYFSNQPERAAESDKAWDAMHRALTDGELDWNGDGKPLSHVILGGEPLYSGDDYIVSLKTPEQVREAAETLTRVTESAFRERYFSIDPESYGCDVNEDDFQYTWHWFQEVREFWLRAANEGRFVMFTADQ